MDTNEKPAEAQDTAATTSTEKVEGVKPTIREHVAKERAAKEGTAKVEQSASTDKADAKEGDADVKDEKADAPKMYTAQELVEADDLRELDPKRIPPELKSTLAKLQAAEGRKHKALKSKSDEIDLKLKQLDEMIAKAKPGTEAKPTELEEDDTLPLSKQEIKDIIKSPAGQAALAESLEDLGYHRVDAVNAAESRLVVDAVANAKTEDPRLQDEKFFDETIEAIKGDERLSKMSKKEKVTGAELLYVFLSGANLAARARLDSETAAIAKEREQLAADKERLKKAEREDKNRAPGSKTVGNRQPIVPSGERPSIRDFVKSQRAAR